MKEKVAICTLYDSINCGTFLQAWSLKKNLERMDCDVFFVELKNNNSSISKKNKVNNCYFIFLIFCVNLDFSLSAVFFLIKPLLTALSVYF